MSAWYLDSSAIVKFAVAETESDALVHWRAGLESEALVSSPSISVATNSRKPAMPTSATALSLASNPTGVNGQQDLPVGGQQTSRPTDTRNPGGRTADLRVRVRSVA